MDNWKIHGPDIEENGLSKIASVLARRSNQRGKIATAQKTVAIILDKLSFLGTCVLTFSFSNDSN